MSDRMDPHGDIEHNTEGKTMINVKGILEQIRSDIEQKGYIREMLSFEDVKANNELHQCVSQPYDTLQMLTDNRAMNELYHPILERPLQNGRKLLGRPIKFMQRIVRKGVRFYISPYVMEQEAFNAAATRFANQITSYVLEGENSEKSFRGLEDTLVKLVNKDIPRLLQDVAECKIKIEALNKELMNVKQVNDRLETDNQVLKAKIELMELKQEKEKYVRQLEDHA